MSSPTESFRPKPGGDRGQRGIGPGEPIVPPRGLVSRGTPGGEIVPRVPGVPPSRGVISPHPEPSPGGREPAIRPQAGYQPVPPSDIPEPPSDPSTPGLPEVRASEPPREEPTTRREVAQGPSEQREGPDRKPVAISSNQDPRRNVPEPGGGLPPQEPPGPPERPPGELPDPEEEPENGSSEIPFTQVLGAPEAHLVVDTSPSEFGAELAELPEPVLSFHSPAIVVPEQSRRVVEQASRGEQGEVTGPVRLAAGENFYNQFPYRETFLEVAERTGMSVRDLRHLITSYIKRLDGDPRFSITPIIQNKLLPSSFSHQHGHHTSQNMRIALQAVIAKLDEGHLPLWREYVNAKLAPSSYRFDGSYNSQARMQPAEPTYLAWAEECLRLDRRIIDANRILAVGEAFPQQVEGVTPTDTREVIMKTWRIRKTRGLSQ